MINRWLSENPDVLLSNLQYKDLGRSGYHGTHLKHEFGELLDSIEDGLIARGDYILVEAIDRIGRLETITALNIITGICMKGVKIITLEDGNEYSQESISANAGIIYYLIGKIDMAHNYSKNLSRRGNSAWDDKREKAENGLGVNRKSFWYITKGEDNKFNHITPQDKALVNKIFTMYLSGVTQGKIVKFLKDQDPIRFKTFSSTALKNLLLNKTAIGYWDDIPNVYEPAIEEQLFYSVQKEVTKRTAGKTQGNKSDHIMAGLVVCKRCGKNYAIRNQKHSAAVMYCSNSNKGGCTNTKIMPLAILIELRIRSQNAYSMMIIDSQVTNDNMKFVVALDGKIDTLNKSIENMLDLVADGISSAKERLLKYEAELEKLKLERIGLVQTESPAHNIANLKQAGLDMSTDPIVLNGMLKQVGYKIFVEDKIISMDTDHMEYIKYIKGTRKQLSGYQVSVYGEKEIIAKVANTNLSQEEQVNALIKAPTTKDKSLPIQEWDITF
jgi:DNA invertase Pin-like site-specific DNA recombinase